MPHRRSSRTDALRVVSIGGGTGLSSLLRGLKRYVEPSDGLPPIEIAAVVTVTDDGGSSGRLRRELDVLPPGDIRNCLVALSDDGDLLTKLFQYRFTAGKGLSGHNFGNLFLTALTQLTGDFAHAVKLSSQILSTGGRIFPSTDSNVTLEAELVNGKRVLGETRISRARVAIKTIQLQPRVCPPLPETLRAIEEADLITMGPGSLYTSVIPNLLVAGIPQAIRRSRALKAYFCNLMWQPWETMNYSACDHVDAIHRHAGGPLLDFAVLNKRAISGTLRRAYAAQKVYPVANDTPRLIEQGIEVIERNLLLTKGEKVRHDPVQTAAIVLELALRARQQRQAR
ncbi:MAG: YvcK family protein [Bryobacteraceae bacterium]|nr:YvcK family protein [Bryobacteraceae bacterium]